MEGRTMGATVSPTSPKAQTTQQDGGRTDSVPPPSTLVRALAQGQAVYFAVTGVWPLVSMRTFEAVTGPKTDHWLVRTVGILVTVIGAVVGLAGWRRRVPPEIPVLAVGSAAGLAAIDVVYVAKGRISPIYLLDALAEAVLIVVWLVAWPLQQREAASGRAEHDHAAGGQVNGSATEDSRVYTGEAAPDVSFPKVPQPSGG